MMKIKVLSIAVMALNFYTTSVLASNSLSNYSADYYDDFYGDEEFVSISTGTKKSIHSAPAVATVITADEIEMMGVNTVHQIIESVTGIHTYPSKLNRMNPSYSIRGVHTDENPQVLVLVNGVRTTFAFTGAKFNAFEVGVNLIDRVEIIRGPGSAVYGADAFSGVVNIITKGVDSLFKNDVGLKTGSFGTKSGWFNYGNQQGDLKLSVNGQWQSTDGDKNRIVQTDFLHLIGLSELSNAPGALDTRHRYIDLHAQIEFRGFYANLWRLDVESGTGGGAAQALSNSDEGTNEQTSIELGYKQRLNDDLDLDVHLHYQQYKDETLFKIFPDGYTDDAGVTYTEGYIGKPIGEDTNLGVEFTANYSGIEEHNLRFSLGHKNTEEITDEFKNFGPGIIVAGQIEQNADLTSVKGTDNIFLGNNKRTLSYLSVQDEWAFASDWELTAGIRYDDYSDFGSTINPRLALVWQTKHNLTSKFLYGSAFRAPSFGELYTTNNPIFTGNPSLDPEEIDTWELAFDYRPDYDWKVLFNIYQYQASGLIATVNGQKENAINQDGVGAEFEVHWQYHEQLKIKWGYSWQKAEYKSNNAIEDAPQNAYDMNIQWQIVPDLQLYADSYWITNRDRAITDPRTKMKNYNLTNLTLNYSGIENIILTLAAKNVFDTDAREASDGAITEDFPIEGRGLWFTGKVNY